MVARDPNQQLERDPAADDEDEGVDFERVKETLGFVLRAPRRRPKLAACVFVLAGALGVAAAVTMPRTYSSEVKLLAQANLVVPALSNPGRAVPRDADAPTKNVGDQILRRDNLTALAKETNLVERYYAARSPALKLKDRILGGPGTDDEKLRIVVATLEKKVSVLVQDNNVIIGVEWADPQMAYDLVTNIQKNFQSARYDDDVAMISDAITVLQEHAKTEADEVDSALAEYQKLNVVRPGSVAALALRAPLGGGGGAPRPRPQGAPGAPAATAAIDPDLAAALEEKRQQIRGLETERQRELETLRAQLAQAQLTLTPQHPTVIALQQKIDMLSAPDPQLAQLRLDERNLMARIAPPIAPPTVSTAPAPPVYAPPPVPRAPGAPSASAGAPLSPPTSEEDPRAQLARSKLEGAVRRYQDAVTRIDGANMELEIARTAFKYRYTVVTPAEVPLKPKKPVAQMVGAASVIGALLLALLMAAGADLWSGRILEEWQVRRRLKLEVLGEFDPAEALPAGPA
jgi:uncharacterized protein involved in exopolysaccharide biosynthesis